MNGLLDEMAETAMSMMLEAVMSVTSMARWFVLALRGACRCGFPAGAPVLDPGLGFAGMGLGRVDDLLKAVGDDGAEPADGGAAHIGTG